MYFLFIPFLLLLLFFFQRKKNILKKYEKNKGNVYFWETKKKEEKVKADKGSYGEWMIYEKLKEIEDDGGRFLFNAYIPRKNKKSTEIDAILVHKSGIYVFESKNYSGYIYGGNDESWTEYIPRKNGEGHRYSFHSPVLQNDYHVDVLSNFLQKPINTYSIIVFSDRCTLKTVPRDLPFMYITKLSGLQECVTDIVSKNGCVMTQKDVDSVFRKIYCKTQVSNFTKQRHIREIKRNHFHS